MNENNRNAMIAAALILAGFSVVAYFLPTIMLAAVEVSPWAAVAVAAAFLLAFFAVFWLRGRSRQGK